MRKFKRDDLFVTATDLLATYRRRKDEEKKSVAWGQRKLFLAELAFLNIFWKVQLPDLLEPVIVYAGAAPGTHIPLLLSFYPQIKALHLYDPRDFTIQPTEQIKIYQEYFTDETAKQWAGRKDILFISDIRTADYTKAKDLDQNEEQIMTDLTMQQDWFNIIQPRQALLKFRLPYPGGNRPNTLDYLDGYVMKQCWAPQTSTETRLIPFITSPTKIKTDLKSVDSRQALVKTWNCQEYEEKLFYFNSIVRETVTYVNPFTGTQEPLKGCELQSDHDSTAELFIFLQYLMLKDSSLVTADNAAKLSQLLTTKLNENKKFKDTLTYLRNNPQAIKKRNMKLP